MPIKYVKGDLFTTDIKCIAHGCNTAGVMGSGVAAVVKKKFPDTYRQYAEYCKPRNFKAEGLETQAERSADILGQSFYNQEKGVMILNMFTQGDWSRAFGTDMRYASYDAIDLCFREANEFIKNYEDKRLAIPMIGAGLGGGDWDVIEKIIEKSTPDIEVTVYQL